MRTLVLSDLHLGAMSGADLLRDEQVRAVLEPELARAERLVLLGDLVELRDEPISVALQTARPFFEWLARTLPAAAELIVVPGNHDHHLLASWVSRQRLAGGLELELEHRVDPGQPLAGLVGEEMLERTTLAYPGVWLRDDVYATHGHYLDRHLTIPTFERLGVGMVEKVLGIGGESPRTEAPEDLEQSRRDPTPTDYERAQAPVYDLLFALAQSGGTEGRIGGSAPSERIWEMLGGGYTRAAKVRGWLLGAVALPGAVGVANRLGLGPVRSDLSPGAIASAGIEAMGHVVENLGIGAEHVIFGHTHRRGPLEGEQSFRAGETKLHNTGCWVYSPVLAGRDASTSAFWPGSAIVIDGQGAPQRLHLLDEWSGHELRTALAR